MTTCAYCLLAVILAGPLPGSAAPQAELLSAPESGLLISRNEAIADISRVCVQLDTTGATYAASHERLAGEAVAKLKSAGIDHAANSTGTIPRLRVCVEAVSLDGCDHSVYRVQTALSRIVTFTDHRELRVQADVWRVNPVMAAVSNADLAKAVEAAVLTQVGAFAGACRAARRFHQRADAAEKNAVASPFVASKNSSVFHRADCRWARNITAANRVTYATREEAIRAGKRPCKTCKP